MAEGESQQGHPRSAGDRGPNTGRYHGLWGDSTEADP